MSADLEVSPDQTEVVKALADGSAVHEAGPLRRIDTHMSHVFIGAARVYKLKRARRHAFIDLSRVSAREADCRAELLANAPFASGLYLGVSPVGRTPDGRLELGCGADPVDWVVVMRRVPDGALFSELLASGRLDAARVAAAAGEIARFHAAQPPEPARGGAEAYRDLVRSLFATERQARLELGLDLDGGELYARLEREISSLAARLEARGRGGWIRRGHGDLHLGNLCVLEGRTVLFDALEFDPALARIDVLYDLAFLLADLAGRGEAGLANAAMNAYWDAGGQPEDALELLPLFMALRATVKRVVALDGGDPAEAARWSAAALRFLERETPRLVAIGGLSGSGKSALAAALAPRLPGVAGARRLRTDVVRRAAPPPAPDRLYELSARTEVYRRLAVMALDDLAAGVSAVLDATFGEAALTEAVDGICGERIDLRIWLQAPRDLRLWRVGRRRDDPSEADVQVAGAQTEPEDLEGWRLEDGGRSSEALAEAALAALAAAARPETGRESAAPAPAPTR